ncbi:MAG: short chain dehydrogenase [Galactobacter sp.]
MKVLIIGATGHIGAVVASTLETRGHEVIRASRRTSPSVDITDQASVKILFDSVGAVDAVIVASGAVPYKPLTELTRDDFLAGFESKTLGQIEVVLQALHHLNAGGSITLTTGVTAREPIATAAAPAAANGALESFVMTAAAEVPRGIRINAVSPNLLQNSPDDAAFAGQRKVSDEEIGRAYVLCVEGVVTGRTIAV